MSTSTETNAINIPFNVLLKTPTVIWDSKGKSNKYLILNTFIPGQSKLHTNESEQSCKSVIKTFI